MSQTISTPFSKEVAQFILKNLENDEYYILYDVGGKYSDEEPYIAFIPTNEVSCDFVKNITTKKMDFMDAIQLFEKYGKNNGQLLPIGKIRDLITFDSENY